MSTALDQITLCTYSTGSTMVREVLEDWFAFLGGKPKEVVCATSFAKTEPPIYDQLKSEGLIDNVIRVDLVNESVNQTDPLAIFKSIEAASTKWVLLIKLDTLPFRSGYDNWLDDDFKIISSNNLFGFTGSFINQSMISYDQSHSLTAKYSNNFSLFQKQDWLNIFDKYICKDCSGQITKEYEGDNIRYAVEAAIESHLRESGARMLVRHESLNWSVFHVNVWGEKLRETRVKYKQRVGVKYFLNTGRGKRIKIVHPWDHLYMYPKPSLYRRIRIYLGSLRRRIVK